MHYDQHVSPFLKPEAYPTGGKPKDPRVIHAMGQSQKLTALQFAYGLVEAFKDLPWYAFDKPKNIELKLLASFEGAGSAFVNDFSRFDGTITRGLREHFDWAFLQAAFDTSTDVRLQSLVNQKVKIKNLFGDVELAYNTHFSQNTGDGLTSLGHTIRNAGLHYQAFRACGLQPHQAWEALGLYGGDDGVTPIPPDLDPGYYQAKFTLNAQAYKLNVTNEVIEFGRPVEFLARYFMPWSGSNPSSMANIARQMAKLHYTPRLPGTPEAKLREKLLGFALTDSNTPILGEYVTYALEKLGRDGPRCEGAGRWWDQFDPDDQYTNEYQDWMGEIADEYRKIFDYTTFRGAIDAGFSPLSFPVCREVTAAEAPSREVVIDGNIVPAERTKDDSVDHPKTRPAPKQRKERTAAPTTTPATRGASSVPQATAKDRGRGSVSRGRPPAAGPKHK
jgi:hypothetical protein